MTYRGYTATLEIDEDNQEIFGRVNGINGIVTFHSPTVAGAFEEFAKSVDSHLAFLARQGLAADKPFSGRFNVRIDPEQHRALAVAAMEAGVSLNDAVKTALAEYMKPTEPPDPSLAERLRAASKPSARNRKQAIAAET